MSLPKYYSIGRDKPLTVDGKATYVKHCTTEGCFLVLTSVDYVKDFHFLSHDAREFMDNNYFWDLYSNSSEKEIYGLFGLWHIENLEVSKIEAFPEVRFSIKLVDTRGCMPSKENFARYIPESDWY